jgi:hypothetical protein
LFAGGGNFHLSAGSLCIDSGTDGLTLDLEGTPRPLDGDASGTAAADIGCYEFISNTADSDGDTMTDGWENDHGLNATIDDAAENLDNDPHNNREEFIADTDPTNSNDYFRIVSVSNLPPFTVYFDSSSNRLYTMIGCSNLVDGVWTNVPGGGPQTGSGGADVMQDTNVPPRGSFYRLEVELP